MRVSGCALILVVASMLWAVIITVGLLIGAWLGFWKVTLG